MYIHIPEHLIAAEKDWNMFHASNKLMNTGSAIPCRWSECYDFTATLCIKNLKQVTYNITMTVMTFKLNSFNIARQIYL